MVGSVSVTNASGSVVLDAEGETSEIAPGQPPVQGTTLSTAEVAASFGDVLSGLPPTPARFTLYFEFNSDQLTDASEALIPEILQTLSARPADTILLVGHTDTTGDAETNFRTGLSRATRVQELLADAGVTAGSVDVISLGENDLLVETPDETAEPRNRRVEIILP